MTPEFRKEAHMLAAMFAMNGFIQRGMREEDVAEAAYKAADDLMSQYDNAGIVAALKPKRGKK